MKKEKAIHGAKLSYPNQWPIFGLHAQGNFLFCFVW
jgi:hypothetical protein